MNPMTKPLLVLKEKILVLQQHRKQIWIDYKKKENINKRWIKKMQLRIKIIEN